MYIHPEFKKVVTFKQQGSQKFDGMYIFHYMVSFLVLSFNFLSTISCCSTVCVLLSASVYFLAVECLSICFAVECFS